MMLRAIHEDNSNNDGSFSVSEDSYSTEIQDEYMNAEEGKQDDDAKNVKQLAERESSQVSALRWVVFVVVRCCV